MEQQCYYYDIMKKDVELLLEKTCSEIIFTCSKIGWDMLCETPPPILLKCPNNSYLIIGGSLRDWIATRLCACVFVHVCACTCAYMCTC